MEKYIVMSEKSGCEKVNDYFATYPNEIQEFLWQVRKVIREEAPDAEETINYGIPTFKLNGNLVHYAGLKKHIGFYPAPVGIEQFKEQLSVYKQGKGSVQFPINKPLPLELIREIVRFRVAQNIMKEKK